MKLTPIFPVLGAIIFICNSALADLPLCSLINQYDVRIGLRCKIEGALSGGFDHQNGINKKIEFEGTDANPIIVQRVKYKATDELGWLDERTGTVYLDYTEVKSIDGNAGVNQLLAEPYCAVIREGKKLRELLTRDDVLNIERHGLREVLRDGNVTGQFWTSTVVPYYNDGRLDVADLAYTFEGKTGYVSLDYTRSFLNYGRARCVARMN